MDEEGFSGRDGRTTIFDYWSLPLVRAWRGEGARWTTTSLPAEARQLRQYYKHVLAVAQEPAVSSGSFYDLTYANHMTEGYDVHRTFSFMRSVRGETLLVVANFAGDDRDLTVDIPAEARVPAEAVDLLTGKSRAVAARGTTVTVRVPAYDAVVLRLK